MAWFSTKLLIVFCSLFSVAPMSYGSVVKQDLHTSGACATPGPLGMKSGLISDDSITASSWLQYNTDFYGPQAARLDQYPLDGWVKHISDESSWIQVDLQATGVITGLQTQGGVGQDKSITSFKVRAGTEPCMEYVKGSDNNPKVFSSSSHSTQTHTFPQPVDARYVRIEPTQCKEYCALRFEILGCLTRSVDTECYTDYLARDYRGINTATKSGKTCQKWTAQTPHSHGVTPENYPEGGLGDHNYCRNPDNEPGGAWCYTIEEATRWEYCDLGERQNICYQGEQAAEQRGISENASLVDKVPTRAVCASPQAFGMETGDIPGSRITSSTINGDNKGTYGPSQGRVGNTYKPWIAHGTDHAPWIQVDLYGGTNVVTGVVTQGSPNDDEWVTSFKVRVGTEECDLRYILDGNNKPIVFTGNLDRNTKVTSTFPSPVEARYVRIEATNWNAYKSLRFEVLGCLTSTSFPSDSECFTNAKGQDYRGRIAVTTSGKTCQKWTVYSPQSHSFHPGKYPDAGLGNHNYCRNPDGEPRAWCYTTDTAKRWELCDVGQPQASC